MGATDMWKFQDETWSGADLTGFGVEALDGGIGKVDEASQDVGASYVVVDTGPWILGKRVLLPAGLIQNVDIDDGKIFVGLTKDEIKSAPEFDEDAYSGEGYRSEIEGYYGSLPASRRETVN